MSHSRHKRKNEERNYATSRSNVFDRLGGNNKEQVQENWPVHASRKSSKGRSSMDLIEKQSSDRISERWSSSRMEPVPSSSKMLKSKRDYGDNYKQDYRHYEGEERQLICDPETMSVKKQRSPFPYKEDYESRKKKKHRSPQSNITSASASPLSMHERHEVKRSKQESISPQPKVPQAFEKEYERGRSKERKSKKLRTSKIKDPSREMKVSRSYDPHKEAEAPGYRSSSIEYHHKKHREIPIAEELKPKKDTRSREYKPGKYMVGEDLYTRSHTSASREETDVSYEEKPKAKKASTKSSHKASKEEKVYEYEEPKKTSPKKSKSNKVEIEVVEEVKQRKKKSKTDKEDRFMQYNKQLEECTVHEKKKAKELYSDGEVPQTSPTKHKSKTSKYYKNVEVSDAESDVGAEKRVKLKKKKKQKIEEEPEPVKKKKLKHRDEEVPPAKKKASEQQFELLVETKEKSKKLKKRRKVKEESTSSDSDSDSEEIPRGKKRSHSDRRDASWETIDDIDQSSRSYKKQSGYDSSKDRHRAAEEEPKRKRSKLKAESPGSSSSRSNSRIRPASPVPFSKYPSDRSHDHDAYRSRDEKLAYEDDMRKEVRYHGESVPHYKRAPEQSYSDRKIGRNTDKYPLNRSMEDLRPADHRMEEKKPYYDSKNAPRYYDKTVDSRFVDNRPYPERKKYDSRSRGMLIDDKKMHFEDMKHRDTRRDFYPVEQRKQKDDYVDHDDMRRRHEEPRHPDAYHQESKSSRPRGYHDSRHPDWQGDRGKVKAPGGEFGGGASQRVSSWVEDRDGSKLRIEARDRQAFRKTHEGPPPRIDVRDQRSGRSDSRDQRDPGFDLRTNRSGRQDVRNHPVTRHDQRDPRREKWVHEKLSPMNDGRAGGHQRYSADRGRSHDDSGQFLEERSSPAFYREVRRSGENRHHDLGIEITIRDDGERKQRGSPARKVLSYDASRSRDRHPPTIHKEPTLSLHGERSDPDGMRYERTISPHRDGPASRYHRGKDLSYPSHGGHARPDSRERGRMIESKQSSSSRKSDGMYTKADRLRSTVERDHSRDSSLSRGERLRDSSGSLREKSRDKSQSSRDRSRSDQRDSHQTQRTEKSDRKSSKPSRSRRESPRDLSESDKKRNRSKLPDKRSKEKQSRESRSKPEAANVLDVDWTGITSSDKRVPSSQSDTNSIVKRFTPGNVLLRTGVSSKLLPKDVLEKVRSKCQEEIDQSKDAMPLVLDRDLGALNRNESLRRWTWNNAFSSPSSGTARLTSFADAEYRRSILGINEDLLFPSQPPQIINAKTYASSVKHYLSKNKPQMVAG